MSKEKVLVVEDEENLLAALKYNLEREGYLVHTASDGEEAIAVARQVAPDLIVLDIMLPKVDGLEVCRILRRESNVPILILTAKSEEVDRIVGLELGADDYVTKPFSVRELIARVKAIMRRQRPVSETSGGRLAQVLAYGDLEVDIAGHIARRGGTVIELKPNEFDLLALLMTNMGIALTREQILERLWGHGYIGDNRTVDVHIRWIREKIEVDPSTPKRIVTVRGLGYRFDG